MQAPEARGVAAVLGLTLGEPERVEWTPPTSPAPYPPIKILYHDDVSPGQRLMDETSIAAYAERLESDRST